MSFDADPEGTKKVKRRIELDIEDPVEREVATSFEIYEDEYKKIREWDAMHECKYDNGSGRKYAGAIGGRLTYIINPTSIGCVIKVKCSCGEELTVRELS